MQLFLSIAVPYGALLAWPLSHLWLRRFLGRSMNWLRLQFFLQLGLLAAAHVFVEYSRRTFPKDWLHSLVFLYAVGMLAWCAVLAIFAAAKLRNEYSVGRR